MGYYDSMNLYQYCGNDPINYIDPMGFCKEQERKDKTDEGIDKTKKPPKKNPTKPKGPKPPKPPRGGGGEKNNKPWWKKTGDWAGDKLENANEWRKSVPPQINRGQVSTFNK